MTQKELKEILYYDKDTGIFTWRVRKAYKTKVGGIAGTLEEGYRYIAMNGKRYRAHRLAWLYTYGELPKGQIDHGDHNKDNNQIKNLRDVTSSQNSKNRSISNRNTSGTPGVIWHKHTNKWCAQIAVNGKKKWLGVFTSKQKAIKAREIAKVEYGYHTNHA